MCANIYVNPYCASGLRPTFPVSAMKDILDRPGLRIQDTEDALVGV